MMIDVVAKVIDVLNSVNWGSLSVPVLTTDEYDPRNPSLQLLIENFPTRSKWITEATYRIEHKIRLILFQKPVRYSESEIDSAKETFYGIRDKIDEVLAKNKFTIEDVTNLVLGGWDDKDSLRVGRGTKGMGSTLGSRGGGDTRITFRSEQVVTAIYYTTAYNPLEE